MVGPDAVALRKDTARRLLLASTDRLAAVLELEPLPEFDPAYVRAWGGVPLVEALAHFVDRAATKAAVSKGQE